MRVVLVHGAWHDATCWAPVVPLLAASGHDVVAVDLPAGAPGPGAEALAEVVVAAAGPRRGATDGGRAADGRRRGGGGGGTGDDERVDPDVVVVAHSLGGLVAPVAAERLGAERVAALVLVAALLPHPGGSLDERTRAGAGQLVAGFGRGQRRREDRTTYWPADAAATELYAGVADELVAAGTGGREARAVVAAAVARLRPQAWTTTREPSPLRAWPPVPTTVVVCAQDRVVDPARLRAEAAAVPGAVVVDLPGGHFPMLTRPARLAEVLDGVARSGRPRAAGRGAAASVRAVRRSG